MSVLRTSLDRSVTALLLAVALACGGGDQATSPPGPQPKPQASPLLNFIPRPSSVQDVTGKFEIIGSTGILVDAGNAELASIGQYLSDRLKPATGYALPVASSGSAAGAITITTSSDATLGEEGYELAIQTNGVRLSSFKPAGAFHGVQSLRQLLPAAIEKSAVQAGPWPLPAGHIRDLPAHSWRGCMLDVARHFVSVDEVKRYIDLLAYYKYNRFHLHLTDDQGWRIEIKSWPKLTTLGGSSSVGNDNSGWYTQDQYKDLVAYAAARYITVVPEIDMPGHMNAALASYAELNADGVAPPLCVDTGIINRGLTAGKAETTQFLTDILGELADMTAGPWIHLGGDEAAATSDADYQTIIAQARGIIEAKGKHVIGFDDLSKVTDLTGVIAQTWQDWNPALTQDAVAKGAKVIMSPAEQAYLCWRYTPYDTTGLLLFNQYNYEVKGSYDWDPATVIPGVGNDAILGVEAALWGETNRSRLDMDYLSFPRLCCISEVGWTPAADRSWDDFKVRLGAQGPRLSALGVGFYVTPQVPWVPVPAVSSEALAGWNINASNATQAKASVDPVAPLHGDGSLLLTFMGSGNNAYANLYKTLDASAWAGKRLRISTWVRSEGCQNGWTFWLSANDTSGNQVAAPSEIRFQEGPSWYRAQMILDLPAGTSDLSFGCALGSPGRIWMEEPLVEVIPSTSTPFVQVQQGRFTLNQKPHRFVGANFWGAMNLAAGDASGDRARLGRELDLLQQNGVTNLRIMASSEGPDDAPQRMTPALMTAPGTYNPIVLDGLDYLLSELAKRDMKAVMVLNNYWQWSGGMAQYVSWHEHSAIPYPTIRLDGTDDGTAWPYMQYAAKFFTYPQCQGWYQDHIQALVNRVNPYTQVAYRDDPAIFAWELANEPMMFTPTWVDDTAVFIKSLDPNHLVIVGSMGGAGIMGWDRFFSAHLSPNIDYTTVHVWIYQAGFDAKNPSTYATGLAAGLQKLQDSSTQATQLHKPLVLEEFGLARDWEPLHDLYDPAAPVTLRNGFLTSMYGAVESSIQLGGPLAGSNFWAWAGEGRPGQSLWIGDPPHETPGWLSVYDTDATTLSVISTHAAAVTAAK